MRKRILITVFCILLLLACVFGGMYGVELQQTPELIQKTAETELVIDAERERNDP